MVGVVYFTVGQRMSQFRWTKLSSYLVLANWRAVTCWSVCLLLTTVRSQRPWTVWCPSTLAFCWQKRTWLLSPEGKPSVFLVKELLSVAHEKEWESVDYFFLFAQKSTLPLHCESPSYTLHSHTPLTHHAVTFAIHLSMITFLYNWHHPLKLLHQMQKSWHTLMAMVPFQMEFPLVLGVLCGCVCVCVCVWLWKSTLWELFNKRLFLIKEQHFLITITFVLWL